MNRRDFIIRTGTVAGSLLVPGLVRGAPSATSHPADSAVAFISDPADPVASSAPVRWAAGELRTALEQRGLAVRLCRNLGEAGNSARCLVIAGGRSSWLRDAGVQLPTTAEALALAPARLEQREVLVAAGSDVRGLVYALTELTDAITLGEDPTRVLRPTKSVIEQPANVTRSVMRMPISEVEDKSWFNDRDFWRRYLSLLVTQRFNRFNLALGLGYDRPNNLTDTYFYFAYPFLVSVPGYNVRATNLSDAERDRNLEMLRFISDEAAARGLQFQLGLWTHAYQWITSPNANHIIEGLTPQTQAPYSRDALAIILKECPNITGVTFRIHGESGVPEGSYDLWRTIFDGMVRSGRPLELDMHAKGMDQPTLDVALGTGLPVVISPKFWAEHLGLPYHQAAIRPAELPKREHGSGLYAQSEGARSFLRYGYGDLLKEDRRYNIVHRVWPGTQHLFLWGDPAFASAYGRAMQFCGSHGGEIFDPLSFKGREGASAPGARDRNGYSDRTLTPAGGDFEKYTQTYRLWGRALYNPDASPEVLQRGLRHDLNGAAESAGAGLASASRILPLLTTAYSPSASNYSFGFEMGPNMSLVHEAKREPYGETKAPERFGNASPLDPQLFLSADDFAAELVRGDRSARYSPIDVARWIEDLAGNAHAALNRAEAAGVPAVTSPAYRRLAIDTRAQAELGVFYAKKFRAAVLYNIYLQTGHAPALAASIAAYRLARDAWARLAEVTRSVYVSDLAFGARPSQRGSWTDRLPAIDADIATLASQPAPALASSESGDARKDEELTALVRQALARPAFPTVTAQHTCPATFRPGEAVPLQITLGADEKATSVQLHYRHANQAESWQASPMSVAGGQWSASIPAPYTQSVYPLLYYFAVASQAHGAPVIYPGLSEQLTQQPYFVLRSRA